MAETTAPSEKSRRAIRLAALSCFVLAPLGIPWLLWVALGVLQLEANRTVLLVFFVPGIGGVLLALWRLRVGFTLYELGSAVPRGASHGSTHGVAALGAISVCTGAAATAYAVWALLAGDWAHHSMIWMAPMIGLALLSGWLVCAHGVLLLRARRQLSGERMPPPAEISGASAARS